MEKIGSSILQIPLCAANALESVVTTTTALAKPLLGTISNIYNQHIAGTLGGSLCNFLSSTALTAWTFTVVKVAVGLSTIVVIYKLVESLIDNYVYANIKQTCSNITAQFTMINAAKVCAGILGVVALGVGVTKLQN